MMTIAGAFVGWSTTVAVFSWWLSDQFKKTRHTITGAMDFRFNFLDEKIEAKTGALDERLRKVEVKVG